jgi:hypothetical protein
VQVSVAASAVTAATGTGNAAVAASKAYNTVIPVVRTALVSFEESPAPALIGFGGAEDATAVADPTDGVQQGGAYREERHRRTVGRHHRGRVPGRRDRTAALLEHADAQVSARVWSPVAGIPVRLKVENSANPSQSAETEATVSVASGWQTLTFDFATPASGTAALNPASTYNKASVFFNFGTTGAATGARTYFLDDLSFVGSSFTAACAGATSSTVTVTMDESTAPTFAGFGGAEDASIVADPAGGTNKVARVVKSAAAELWAGTTVSTLAGNQIAPIGFSATAKTITVRVWSPAANVPVRLKVENAADASKSVETEATVTAANTWQTLTFNFANQVAGTAALDLAATYNRASIFFNFGTPGAATGARTYFFEDLSYPNRRRGGEQSTRIDFEGTAPTFAGFGGAEDAGVVTDPTDASEQGGAHRQERRGRVVGGHHHLHRRRQHHRRIAFATGSTTDHGAGLVAGGGHPGAHEGRERGDGGVGRDRGHRHGGQRLADAELRLRRRSGTAALNLAATYNRLSVFFNFGMAVRPPARAPTSSTTSSTPLRPAAAATAGAGLLQRLPRRGRHRAGRQLGLLQRRLLELQGHLHRRRLCRLDTPVADDDQYFFIAVTTTAPTAAVGTSPSGGFLGMYVTHPGLALTGQTTLAVNLGMDENFFRQSGNKNIDVLVVGSTNYSNGSGGDCKVTLKGTSRRPART